MSVFDARAKQVDARASARVGPGVATPLMIRLLFSHRGTITFSISGPHKNDLVHFHWPSYVSHPVECWVLIAYPSNIGAYIFYYRSCSIYVTMSLASKEAVIEDAFCELCLEEHIVMQYLR